jgi:hypothetical protein
MSAEADALRFDAENKPLPAIDAYEDAITEGTASLESYLNLAVLYLKCADFGYAAGHRIPDALLDGGFGKALDTLRRARERFGPRPEVRFWELYIPYIYLGDQPNFYEEAEELVQSGETLVPYFYLLARDDWKRFTEGAKRLYASATTPPVTGRKNYVRGLLEANIGRPFHRLGKSPR